MVLKWFAAMTTHLSPDIAEMFLVHILAPVYRITEDESVRDPRMGTFFIPFEMYTQLMIGNR